MLTQAQKQGGGRGRERRRSKPPDEQGAEVGLNPRCQHAGTPSSPQAVLWSSPMKAIKNKSTQKMGLRGTQIESWGRNLGVAPAGSDPQSLMNSYNCVLSCHQGQSFLWAECPHLQQPPLTNKPFLWKTNSGPMAPRHGLLITGGQETLISRNSAVSAWLATELPLF